MKSKRSKEFRKLLAQLPLDVQNQAKDAYHLFQTNPYHPSLHFKRIDPHEPIYSVRVGRSYRAIGEWRGDTIIWSCFARSTQRSAQTGWFSVAAKI